jgi:unsaturated chondroitin disaccharide hydrolase
MKRIDRRLIIFGIFTLMTINNLWSQALEKQRIHALQFAGKQLRLTLEELRDGVRFPRSTSTDGTWKTVSNYDWTSGFFPGCLWYAFENNRDPFFKKAAKLWTERLDSIQYFKGTHDIGFMIFCSYGNGYRLTKNENYKKVILQAARSLTTRFNPKVGCIKSWDDSKWPYPVIIDNMMNLELLFWASRNGGTKEMYDIAFSHAEMTMQNHFRNDGSTYHVLGYDTTTGNVLTKETAQGYTDSSCWARGQAWSIYGFTVTYRFTKDKRFLQTAQRAADYFIAHLPADDVPYWDFQAPNIPDAPRDASAAAIAASGLFELSTSVTDAGLRTKYFEAAENILRSLCSSSYLAEGTPSHALLNHCVGHKPNNSEVDVSLIYGDYYFLEALSRYTVR